MLKEDDYKVKWQCTALNSDVLRHNFWSILNDYLKDGWEPYAVGVDKFWLRKMIFVGNDYVGDFVDGNTDKES